MPLSSLTWTSWCVAPVVLSFAVGGCGRRGSEGFVGADGDVDSGVNHDTGVLADAAPLDAREGDDMPAPRDAGIDVGEASFAIDGDRPEVRTMLGGPHIIRLTTSASDVTPFTSVVVTAIVTDPDGIDDLIGGTLSDAASSRDLGAFVSPAAEGAYSFTVTWGALNAAAAITARASSTTRDVIATFYDSTGRAAMERLTLNLACTSPATSDAICGGLCVDTRTDPNHCGECGRAVPIGDELVCRDGVVVCHGGFTSCGGACVDTDHDGRHCGGCDRPVPPGMSCIGGTVACPLLGHLYCGGRCVDAERDPRNCGRCGRDIETVGACVHGAVQLTVRGTTCDLACEPYGTCSGAQAGVGGSSIPCSMALPFPTQTLVCYCE